MPPHERTGECGEQRRTLHLDLECDAGVTVHLVRMSTRACNDQTKFVSRPNVCAGPQGEGGEDAYILHRIRNVGSRIGGSRKDLWRNMKMCDTFAIAVRMHAKEGYTRLTRFDTRATVLATGSAPTFLTMCSFHCFALLRVKSNGKDLCGDTPEIVCG